MKAQEIETGKRYWISGDLENGFFNGKPYICHEEVTRVVTRVTDTHVICECSRRFLNNQNLKIEQR
jgi:hypothetical protein